MIAACSRVMILGTLAILAAGCGSRKPSMFTAQCVPLAKQEFAYALNTSNADVSMFTLDSCAGTFTPTTPASAATGILPGQLGAEDMVVDPLGRFAYVANLVSNASSQSTIAMYTINPSSGVLSPTTPPTVPTGWFPQGITIDPLGKFVYTANSDDDTISMFTINATTGVLTPTTPAAVAAGKSPVSVTVHPSGKFAYAANRVDGTISMYTIDSSTGVLSPVTPAAVSGGADPFGITFDASGKFAYVPDNFSHVIQYAVDQNTGVLVQSTPGAVATGQGPTAVAVDPSGKFAYVVNRLDNTVSMFTINPANGTLNPNGAATTIATGTQPFRILFDPGKRFLYVVNEESAASVFTIKTDGTLASAGKTGPAALSMAIVSAR
ncbi:MAG TPA: beta-propeller fold lactonase family protein [Candidatus Angelobacter sp.]